MTYRLKITGRDDGLSEPSQASVPGWVAGRARSHARILILVLAALWTVASNRGVFGPPRGDSLDYRRISTAAPSLPDEVVGSAYTGRFAPHYVIGSLADVTEVPLGVVYALAFSVVVGCLLAVVHRLLRQTPFPAYVLCVWLLVPSPYFVRPYLADPGSVQDLVFVLGTALSLLALLRCRPGWVLCGLAVAALGRQSALVTCLAVAVWVLVDTEWRRRGVRRAQATAAAAVVVVLVIYQAVGAAVSSFTEDFEPHVPEDTVLYRLDEMPGVLSELLGHGSRTVVPVAALGAIVVALLVACRSLDVRVPWGAWGALLLAAAIFAQPLAVDPAFPGFAYNEQRLAALCLVPLATAAALLVAPLAVRPLGNARGATALVLLLLASLHHTFTRVGPSGVGMFLAGQTLAGVGLAAVVYLQTRRPRHLAREGDH